MSKIKDIIMATKCVPHKKILSDIKKSGLEAVELYLSEAIMNDLQKIIKLCRDFPFRYAIHAPDDCYNPKGLIELVESIGAEVVVFHNVYWEDEWKNMIKMFKHIKTKLCIENMYSLHEFLKFNRRYGLGRCLDLEHLQMECCGVYEEEFTHALKEASHIHLTGYIYGSQLWHTHIHHSPKHSTYILNLLRDAGYSGFVVSEARVSFQTYEEFKQLNHFFKMWNSKNSC